MEIFELHFEIGTKDCRRYNVIANVWDAPTAAAIRPADCLERVLPSMCKRRRALI